MPMLAASSSSEDHIQAGIVRDSLTAQRTREVLSYDRDSGALIWRRSAGSRAIAGRPAGCSRSDGYRLVGIDGHHYMAHRLVWLIVYGVWPSHQIDHINMDRSDNRLQNLRDVSASENQANVRARSFNSIGLKGVSRTRSGRRFRARITVGGREIGLGQYATAEEAHAVYASACVVHFGESSRLA